MLTGSVVWTVHAISLVVQLECGAWGVILPESQVCSLSHMSVMSTCGPTHTKFRRISSHDLCALLAALCTLVQWNLSLRTPEMKTPLSFLSSCMQLIRTLSFVPLVFKWQFVHP